MYVRDEKYVSDENGMLVTKKSVGDERYVSDENEYVGDEQEYVGDEQTLCW